MKKLLLIFIIFVYSLTTLAYADITTGLIAHYEFENNANDLAGGDNTGTPSNVTYTAGKFGNAASFNGSNSQIALNTLTNFPTTGSYALSAWIKADTMGYRGIIGWGNYRSSSSIHEVNALRLEPNGLNNFWWFEDLQYTTGDITNNWHHIVATWDSSTSTRSIYVDGVFGSSDTVTGFNASLINGAIGVVILNEYFDGLIDDVRVYSRSLSQSDVTGLFNHISNTAIPSLTLDATATTNEDTAVNINFTASITDGTIISTTATATNGTVVVNANGTITFTPTPNFNGIANITVVTTDNDGDTDTQISIVTVTDVNDAPTLTVDATATTNEDTAVNISFTATDVDGTIASTTATATNGTVVVNANGTITFTPTPNFNGIANITVVTTDNDGDTDTQISIVTVTDVNDAPTLTVDATATTNEDTAVNISFTATDVDGTIASTTATATNGTVVVNANGTITFTPTPNFNGIANITVVTTDDDGDTDTQISIVTVNNVNDTPIITSTPIITTDANSVYDYVLGATDADDDELTWSVLGGTTLPSWLSIGNTYQSLTTLVSSGLFHTRDVAVDQAGNIYIADTYNHAIKKYDVNGVLTTLVSSGLNQPSAIAVDQAGNIYIADSENGAIKKYDVNGVLTTLVSGLHLPYGIAVDQAGNIYISDSDNGAIKKYDVNGVLTTVISSGLTYPFGIVVDSEGNIYLADTYTHSIKKYDVNGVLTTVVSSGLNNPRGVDIDEKGNIYIADADSNSIKKYDVNGVLTTLLSSELNNPYNLAVDEAGNVYIADTDNNAIKKLTATLALNGTPTCSNLGTHDIALILSDGTSSVEHNFTLTVEDDGTCNTAPSISGTVSNQAVLDTATISPFSSVILSDAQNDNVSISITLDSSANGTLSTNSIASGTLSSVQSALQAIVFTPTENKLAGGETETTTFSITINDGTDSTVDANTTVVTTGVNDTPVIISTPITTVEVNHHFAYQYLLQANDVDGDNLTWSVASGTTLPTNFELVFNAFITGTPTCANLGEHNISLVLSDGTESVEHNFTLSITDNAGVCNTAPIISGALANQEVNDTGTILPFSTITLADAEGDNLNVTIIIDDPTKGSLSATSINLGTLSSVQTALQAIVFTPSENRGIAGSTETSTFTIVVRDEKHTTIDNNTTVISTSVNDTPTILSTPITTVEVNHPFSYLLQANDVDGDSLTWSVASGTTLPTNFELVFNAFITGTPTCANLGEHNISLVLSDGTESVEHNFTLSITDNAGVCNTAPSLTVDATATMSEDDENVSINFTATDVDGTIASTTATVTSGTVVVNANGTITFTPMLNFYGEANITVVTTDDDGDTDTQYSIVTVTDVNDAPILSITATATTEEDTAVNISFTATDVDGTVTTTASATNGTVVVESNDSITFIPTLNFFGEANITVVTTDDDGAKDTKNSIVTVTNVNDAPTASNISFTIDEDTNKTFISNDFNFTDVDTGDTLESIFITSLEDNGSLMLNNVDVTLNQEILLADIGNLSFSPYSNDNGIAYATFGFMVNDGESNSTAYTVTINVTAEDDAPVLDPIADINSIEDSTNLNITLHATDEENNPISYTATSSNNNIVTVDIVNGVLVVSQEANAFGVVTIEVTATANGISTAQTFTVNISSVNDAPVIESPLADITLNATTSFTLGLKVNDNEGDDLEVDVSVNDSTFVKLKPQWTNALQQAEYDGVALSLKINAAVLSTEETATVTVRVKDGEFTTSKNFTIHLISTDQEAAIEAENRRKFINILPAILSLILSDTPASED